MTGEGSPDSGGAGRRRREWSGQEARGGRGAPEEGFGWGAEGPGRGRRRRSRTRRRGARRQRNSVRGNAKLKGRIAWDGWGCGAEVDRR